MKWAECCDLVRSQIIGLPTGAGCFIFSSIEAALTESAILIADRDREIGGAKTIIVYGQAQDPALDRMAKTLSGGGLDVKPKNESDFLNPTSWFPDFKKNALFLSFAVDDRFSGRVRDMTAIRSLIFGDGMRVPVISVSFGSSDWRTALPRPFEIRIFPLSDAAGGSAALATVGERLRLEPRLAPLSVDLARLEAIEEHIADIQVPESHPQRAEVENFEAALPSGFQAWWPKGAARMVDRAIITSKEFDGSFVVDRLRAELSKAGVRSSLLQRGLFSLSGCAMNDERRQEWLRARGDDAWLIRGTVHISTELIRLVPKATWLAAFPK